MKTLKTVALLLAIVPALSFARSPVRPFADVAPAVRKLQILEVGREGTILKERHQHPYTNFLVGIPVVVSLGDACTSFVGQQLQTPVVAQMPHMKKQVLSVLGASDVMHDACIEIFPEPIKTQLTLDMQVVTGGFVPADRFHTQTVFIDGLGVYIVKLDLDTKTVDIMPIKYR